MPRAVINIVAVLNPAKEPTAQQQVKSAHLAVVQQSVPVQLHSVRDHVSTKQQRMYLNVIRHQSHVIVIMLM